MNDEHALCADLVAAPESTWSRSDDAAYLHHMKTREQLERLLLDLEERLPRILQQFPPAQRLGTFAYEASVISDAAGPEDWEYVHHRIHSLIDAYGLDRSYRTFSSSEETQAAA